MTDWNNSTEATGDGGLMCSDNPTVHTLHTHQLVTVRGLQNQIANHARVHWVGLEGEHDGGGPKI